MRKLRKIGALVLALAMVLGMTGAMAVTGGYNEETTDTSNVYEHYTNSAQSTTKTSFTDFIVTSELDKNTALAGYGTTAFKYTLAIGSAIDVSTDASGNKLKIYAGLSGAKLNDGTNDFDLGSPLTITFSAGTENTTVKTFKVDLSGVNWPHAGIYRYTLTQTALNSEQLAAGFQNENANGKGEVVKYVDIYVANTAEGDDSPVYKVKNAVIANIIPSVLSVNNNDLVAYTSYGKTDRFTNTFGDDVKDSNDPNHGKNTTNEIIVTKEVTGNMGDKTYQFPFDLTVYYTEPDGTGNDTATTLTNTLFKVEVVGTTGAVVTAPTGGWKVFDSEATAKTYSGAITIPDGGQVKITVPNNVTVKVQEAVEDSLGYTVSSAITEASGQTLTTEQAANSSKRTDETGIAGLIAYTTDETAVALKWTNNLEEISPTGYVSRFAPYALILVAGIVLLVVAKKKKSTDEE